MPENVAFSVNVPLPIKDKDKIRIHAIITDDAKQFSINFVNDISSIDDITYHFKWILEEEVIVQNWKKEGEWVDHLEEQYVNFNGTAVGLEFGFTEDEIYVYIVHGEGRNNITHYSPENDFADIKSIQLWGDIAKVTELNFLYG